MSIRPSLRVRIQSSLREVGFIGVLLLSVDRLLRFVSGGHARLFAYALVAQPIDDGSQAPLRSSAVTTVRRVAPTDALVAAFAPPPEVVQRRFATGAECLAATVHGAFAGTLWIARRQYAEDEVRCLYRLDDPTHCVWDFDVYVEPRFRGSRVLARLWHAADRRLAADGVRWSFSRISVLNKGSLAAHRRLGARPVASAMFLVFGTVQLAFFSMHPFVHLALTRQQRPVLSFASPECVESLTREVS